MPKTGLAYCMAAVYNYANGVITYSDGGYIGRMVRINIQKAQASDNDWYGDNKLGESDDAFGGGDVEIEVGEIRVEAAEKYFGIEVTDLSGADAIPGVTDEDAKLLKFKTSPNIPYVGLGTVVTERRKGDGKTTYTPVILLKTQLQVPDTEATTKSKTISWQNTTAKGKIFENDAEDPDWKYEGSPLSTMAQALAFIRHYLNIPDPTQTANDPTQDANDGE